MSHPASPTHSHTLTPSLFATSHTLNAPDSKVSSGEEEEGRESDVRINEWVRVGRENARVLSLVKELPAVHTPRLIMMLSQRRADWVNSLIALNPKDMLVLQVVAFQS